MSIEELGQYFCAITNSNIFRRFNRRRGIKFPNRSLRRLKVQICLFNSDTTTTISSVRTVQLLLNYFDRHSYDTIVTVYSSIVKIRYYSSKFNMVYWFPRLPSTESTYVFFSLKMWHLVTIILIIFVITS